jgi:hypothetical protein
MYFILALVYAITMDGGGALRIFISAQLYGYVTWFPSAICFFGVGYIKSKKAFRAKFPGLESLEVDDVRDKPRVLKAANRGLEHASDGGDDVDGGGDNFREPSITVGERPK